jgi:neutral trehalase
VETPDINTYLYIQMQALMEMATNLGKNEDAQLWKTRAQILLDAMLHFSWDEEKGLFQALYQEKPLNVLTPLNLYPLWTGALPADMVEKLVAHLNDPAEFGGDVIIPSVARCDPTFDADCMWRGPVWANINYFSSKHCKKMKKKRWLSNCVIRPWLSSCKTQAFMNTIMPTRENQAAELHLPLVGARLSSSTWRSKPVRKKFVKIICKER